MSRAGILLVCFLVAGFAALLFVPQARKRSDVPFTARGVTLHTYTEEGDLWWEIYADEGETVSEDGLLRDVEVRFLSSQETALTATADRFTRGERESILSGAVLVERGDGLRLETDELTWDESEEQLRSGTVQLSRGGIDVQGERFEYDLRDERALITGGIRAKIGDDSELQAERAEIAEDGLTVWGAVSLHLNLASEEESDGP